MSSRNRMVWGARFFTFTLLMVTLLAMTFSERPQGRDFSATIEPVTAIVRTFGTWTVMLKVETDSIKAGAAIKYRFVKGFGKPQYDDSLLANYVKVATTSITGGVAVTGISSIDNNGPWDLDRNGWAVTVTVINGGLRKEDVIVLTYGANAPRGRMAAPSTAFSDTVLISYDLSASGIFEDLATPPVIKILPRRPQELKAYLPAQGAVNSPVPLKIVVTDDYHNLSPDFTGRIFLKAENDSAELPESLRLTTADSGRITVPVIFQRPGVHRIQVRAEVGSLESLPETVSNPVTVTLDDPEWKIFWGDLHTHSRFSRDGNGNDVFEKARDLACLDFFALTDHTTDDLLNHSGINAAEWQETKNKVMQFYDPGNFVTLLGFEYSLPAPSGHHNFYFNGSNEALANVPLFEGQLSGRITTSWSRVQAWLPAGVEFITVPHHTGIQWASGGNAAVTFGAGWGDSRHRPLLEIYSIHGSSEAYAPNHALSYETVGEGKGRSSVPGPHYAQDAWAAGEWLGTIASSDNHSSLPGLPYAGLTAVLVRELTREEVFRALKERRTYATTGARLLLSFKIDGAMMGARVEKLRGEFPHIYAEAHGTDEIEFMEILKWDAEHGQRRNGHPLFEVLQRVEGGGMNLSLAFTDSNYTGYGIYYVRVKQRNEVFDSSRMLKRQVWAWSSPIWVQEPNALDTSGVEVVVRRLQLGRNFPNPSVNRTTIEFYLPATGRSTLKLYDALGREVMTVFDGVELEGWHSAYLNTVALANGVYFLRLQAGTQAATKKMLIAK